MKKYITVILSLLLVGIVAGCSGETKESTEPVQKVPDLVIEVDEEKAIDDYIETIGNHAKKMKKEQLLEQFRYILDPQQKAQILNEIVKLGGQ